MSQIGYVKMKAVVVNCSPVINGATAEIAEIVSKCLQRRYEVRSICIDDYKYGFCKGCRSCHKTARCFQEDDFKQVISQFEWADIIVLISPSYWAGVPGQFKAFIDRCTPWSNTHEPHASIGGGKKGFAVVLRTGTNVKECNLILESIEHFYGHMDIECCGRMGLSSVENKAAVERKKNQIIEFCDLI